MTFNPKEEYVTTPTVIKLKDFHDYSEDYVTRPPYQRKTVWSRKKKQALMDSLLRRFYVPRIVLREVRLSDSKTVDEVIDGQQRISTVQGYFLGEFPLPGSLKDVAEGLAGKYYKDLDVDFRKYIDQLQFQADRILNIAEKDSSVHQRVATEIFWRLQQGESLNAMEVAHARLASRVRNFLVKYADDITFDYKAYSPIGKNPSKHNFFKILQANNDRMGHLSLLARMLLIENSNDYVDLKDTAIQTLIDEAQTEDGVGDDSYEDEKPAKDALANLSVFHQAFKNDPMLKDGGKIKELNREYFILSFYLLIRHLRRHYVFDEEKISVFRRFFDEFHTRWQADKDDDADVVRFSENRQQDKNSVRERDIILRHNFFRFLENVDEEILAKDGQRAFNEAQRIQIYRRDKGMCQDCLAEEKPEKEAVVSWADYEADHILAWIKGGATDVENGRVLCGYHNKKKGAADVAASSAAQ